MNSNFNNEGFSNEELIKMLKDMILIRSFEERVEKLFQQGKIHGTMHLCVGQEATAVGACSVLTNEDKITSTHRGHGHSIAKGTDVNRMMAELLGKETGYCKGKGGSMHISDFEVGNLGANGIVAAGLPLAVGAALTSKKKDQGYATVSFFGDGASNEGAFHEALNLASIWDLPVIFFCENNLYGMSGSIKDNVKIEHISERAAAYGIPGVTINGNDVLEVARVTREAVEKAKRGEGPTLIEAETYRWKGHSKSDARKYRTRDEEKEWRTEKDAILLFKNLLVENKIITQEDFEAMDSGCEKMIDEAVKYSEDSKEPGPETLMNDIFK